MAEQDLDKYLENLGIDVDTSEESEAEIRHPVAVSSLHVDESEAGELERCESFLVHLLLNIDPAYAVDVQRLNDKELRADIYGGDPGKIIGKNGRTLGALEYITNAVMNREYSKAKLRVDIDVNGYKQRRDERLRNTARKAIARARKTGFAVELEPMGAAERRIVHMELAQLSDVMSESTGEGRNRHVVIKPT